LLISAIGGCTFAASPLFMRTEVPGALSTPTDEAGVARIADAFDAHLAHGP